LQLICLLAVAGTLTAEAAPAEGLPIDLAQNRLLSWYYRAKVDLGKERVYDLTSQGEPLPDKKQGRSRTRKKMFGLVDIAPMIVCLHQGAWAEVVVITGKIEEQTMEFAVSGCMGTIIRIHFDRPIEPADLHPSPLARYLSGFFEIEGLGADGVTGAMASAISGTEAKGRRLAMGGIELHVPEEYKPEPESYAGSFGYPALAKGRKDIPLWLTLVESRPMTPEERALGAPALAVTFQQRQTRALNATFGKNLKKRDPLLAVTQVQDMPRLTVAHRRNNTLWRRDYVFDDEAGHIYYFQTSASDRKNKETVYAAVDNLVLSMRRRQAPAIQSLTRLSQAPAEPTPSSPAAAVAVQPAAVPTSQTFKPEVTIVASSVQPAEVKAGDAIKLLIQYEVSGLPPGFSYEVTESRQLLLNEAVIGQVGEPVSRGVGSFTSSKTISVPATASPGFYSFRARVTLAGVHAEASAFFRVQ
jgi:hypothetical protein